MSILVKYFSFQKIPGLCLGIFSLILIVFSFLWMPKTAHIERQLLAPPPMLKHFVSGYREVVADVMWIRTIQDLDFCDKSESKGRCRDNSWLYKMLDSITELSPKFRMPYSAGSLALTVIITDVEGATKIFEKGIKEFPNDWPILYRAAYHYLYEVGDKKRAAELLIRAGQNGAPPFVFTLAGRLYSDSGYLDLAESLLQQMIDDQQDATLIQRLKDKIASMKKSTSKEKKFK